jgi:vacuolar-type H+-ATPase subunit E/Vma4
LNRTKGSDKNVEGIERIKDHIIRQADDEVEVLVSETQRFVAKEVGDAERQVRLILEEATLRADMDAKELVRRGEGLAEAERRKQGLVLKQQRVDQVIDRALDLLLNEPPEERMARYASWVNGLGLESGVITLSATDLSEIGEKLLELLPPDRFSINPVPGEFSGGIVVEHGRVRDNLSYELIVRDHRAELARLVLSHLEEVMPEEL